ncbi:MAG: hypothetical protein ABMB14_14845 [Myxococcota bacterium]
MRGWLGVIAVGCAGPIPETDGGARSWDGPFLIDQIVIDCDGSRSWTYDAWSQGWGDVITVDVVARSLGYVWTEHHVLSEVDYDETSAHFQVELDQAFSEAEYVDSESTLIACDAKTLVTYGFAAWRYDGALEECVAWGLDPAGEFPDCTSWGTDSHTGL